MQTLPLACRFGAAPPELRAHHTCGHASHARRGDRFIADLHGALAALPAALTARVDPLLLGVFYVEGLGSCAVTEVVAASDGGLVGSVVAIDPDALRDVRTRRPALRQAVLRYLLTEAFDLVLAARRPIDILDGVRAA